MAFAKKTWQDRISQYPNRRTINDGYITKTVTVSRNEGTVTQAGDSFNATNMNDLEQRIKDTTDDLYSEVANKASLTEVEGIRTSATGRVFLNSGDAVRTQVSDAIKCGNAAIKTRTNTGAYYTSGNLGEFTTPTLTYSENWDSFEIALNEGDAVLITGEGSATAPLYTFYSAHNQVMGKAASTTADSEIFVAPNGATKVFINVRKSVSYEVIFIKGYDTQSLLDRQIKQDAGNLVLLPYGLETYLDSWKAIQPKRARSLIMQANYDTSITFKGIPNDVTAYLYYVSNLNESITSTKRYELSNYTRYVIPGGSYYRVLIIDNGSDNAWEISSIKFTTALYSLPYAEYDIILFAGQSNMAGRGVTTAEHPEGVPTANPGVGYEYRPISDPDGELHTIAEPFGYNENKVGGLNDGTAKTGSCVTAFANAYFKAGGVPIIAVSASEGGTDLLEWVTGYDTNTGKLYDATQRLRDTITYCQLNGLGIRNVFVVWCQGETDAKYMYDGDPDFTMQDYIDRFEVCQQAFLDAGADKVLVIRIGHRGDNSGGGTSPAYDDVIEKQTELCQTDSDLVMICTDLASFRERGMQKDASHYFQDAYNEFGTYSGINASLYANTLKEPTMYDPYSDDLYYSHKN